MTAIDLRDIVREYDEDDEEDEGTVTYLAWKEALEANGMDIDRVARDEPTFIEECDWEEYVRDYAEEIGAINRSLSWPYTCIDWKDAARELAMDYSQIEVDGTTYYYRS